jgi:predicted TIM-barrel fold metal-dependent hydrolase
MDVIARGAIDCDVHVSVPGMQALLPYLDDAWRELIVARGIDGLELASYPPGAPMSCRPDWRGAGKPATALPMLREAVLDGFGSSIAICNCLHGAQAVHGEDMAAALCRAVNDWLAAEWLDREPRLRASIVVAAQNPHHAVEEIERRAADPRFVQVGRRYYWPIYEAAARHALPVGIHAGSAYRHAPTSIGWPSHITQDSVNQTAAFEAQLLSLMAEGVFNTHPGLRVVLIESGVTWLPAFLWRAVKSWRALRTEAPWMRRSPAELVREHVRLTLQPFDAPGAAEVERILHHLDSDEFLLFSTDYPHWHFDGSEAIPPGMPAGLIEKIRVANPLATYPRLKGTMP